MFICWPNIKYAVVNEPIPKVMPQAPVVQTLYSAIRQAQLVKRWIALSTGQITIRRISITEINHAIRWIVIYPGDSAIQRLNNWGQIKSLSSG